jgi:quinol monooxygenase YgiN
MVVLFVTAKVKPDQRQEFLRVIEEDAVASVRDEPGCLRFDVLQDEADPDTYYFYEVYRDEAAVEAHRQTPHLARWLEASQRVLVEPTRRVRATSVFPRDYR